MKYWFFTTRLRKDNIIKTVNLEIHAVGIKNAYLFWNKSIEKYNDWLMLTNEVSEGSFI